MMDNPVPCYISQTTFLLKFSNNEIRGAVPMISGMNRGTNVREGKFEPEAICSGLSAFPEGERSPDRPTLAEDALAKTRQDTFPAVEPCCVRQKRSALDHPVPET
jgi:hypothetical protein